MNEIKAHRNSVDEPPTVTLERMLEMDRDAIEKIVEQKILEQVVDDALV